MVQKKGVGLLIGGVANWCSVLGMFFLTIAWGCESPRGERSFATEAAGAEETIPYRGAPKFYGFRTDGELQALEALREVAQQDAIQRPSYLGTQEARRDCVDLYQAVLLGYMPSWFVARMTRDLTPQQYADEAGPAVLTVGYGYGFFELMAMSHFGVNMWSIDREPLPQDMVPLAGHLARFRQADVTDTRAMQVLIKAESFDIIISNLSNFFYDMLDLQYYLMLSAHFESYVNNRALWARINDAARVPTGEPVFQGSHREYIVALAMTADAAKQALVTEVLTYALSLKLPAELQERVDAVEAALSNLRRVMKPGGLLFGGPFINRASADLYLRFAREADFSELEASFAYPSVMTMAGNIDMWVADYFAKVNASPSVPLAHERALSPSYFSVLDNLAQSFGPTAKSAKDMALTMTAPVFDMYTDPGRQHPVTVLQAGTDPSLLRQAHPCSD